MFQIPNFIILSLLKHLSVLTSHIFGSHKSSAFFHLFQNTNPHGKKFVAHFVAQLSFNYSQKVCSKTLNNSSEKIRLETLGTDFVNVRATQVTPYNHEKLHDKV